MIQLELTNTEVHEILCLLVDASARLSYGTSWIPEDEPRVKWLDSIYDKVYGQYKRQTP